MNTTRQYHRGILIQKGRGFGGVFSSILRTLLPIEKEVVKSTPKLLKATAKSCIGKKLRKSAKKIALDTAKNLIESGDIGETIKKSVQDSKKEVSNALTNSKRTRRRKSFNYNNCKPKNYSFVK